MESVTSPAEVLINPLLDLLRNAEVSSDMEKTRQSTGSTVELSDSCPIDHDFHENDDTSKHKPKHKPSLRTPEGSNGAQTSASCTNRQDIISQSQSKSSIGVENQSRLKSLSVSTHSSLDGTPDLSVINLARRRRSIFGDYWCKSRAIMYLSSGDVAYGAASVQQPQLQLPQPFPRSLTTGDSLSIAPEPRRGASGGVNAHGLINGKKNYDRQTTSGAEEMRNATAQATNGYNGTKYSCRTGRIYLDSENVQKRMATTSYHYDGADYAKGVTAVNLAPASPRSPSVERCAQPVEILPLYRSISLDRAYSRDGNMISPDASPMNILTSGRRSIVTTNASFTSWNTYTGTQRLNNILSPPNEGGALSPTNERRKSASSPESDQSPHSSEGDSRKSPSILRKPNICRHRREVSHGAHESHEEYKLWKQAGEGGSDMNSGEDSDGRQNVRGRPGLPRKNSLKNFKRRPSSPTPAVGKSCPMPQPHVSIFKRPDSVRLPQHIGSAIPHPHHKIYCYGGRDPHELKDRDGASSSRLSSSRGSGIYRGNRWSHVHFDPRVCVMEYIEDDDLPLSTTSKIATAPWPVSNYSRKSSSGDQDEASPSKSSKWFSAEELNQFKLEAFQQAQIMLLSAPRSRISNHLCPNNQVQQRRGAPSSSTKPRTSNTSGLLMDRQSNTNIPGANGMSSNHKRALFTNPILQCTPEDNIVMEGSEELAVLLRSHVRNVLIVDPDETLRALFQKAMRHLFPQTKVLTTGSAEGALQLIEAAKLMEINTASNENDSDGPDGTVVNNGFDIIIVEERLRASWSRRDSFADDDDAMPNPLEEAQAHMQPAGEDHAQDQRNSSRGKIVTTGSDLLQLITKEEKKWMQLRELQEGDCSCDLNLPHGFRPSLYIGVSVSLADDGPRLLQSGADLIWGKPPPKIDNSLRNQLVTTLLKNRGKSVLICGI